MSWTQTMCPWEAGMDALYEKLLRDIVRRTGELDIFMLIQFIAISKFPFTISKPFVGNKIDLNSMK